MAVDVASGVYWHLSSLPDVLGVTGSFPAEEPDNSSVPWTVVRNVYTRMEDVSIVKGSQAVALVCCYMGQGRSPLETSTVRFQRLKIDIWVDPLRDVMGNVTNPSETEHRGLNVYSVLDSRLHRVATDQMTQLWGDLITVAATVCPSRCGIRCRTGTALIRGACFYSVGTFGNYGPVIQVGSGESGSGGDVGG